MPDRLLSLADRFTHEIYRVTRRFPREEQYGVTNQLRRASLSIPLNILEGFARQRKTSYRQFLEIAYGSLREAKYLLRFSYQEEFLEAEEFRKLLSQANEIGRLLWAILKTVRAQVIADS